MPSIHGRRCHAEELDALRDGTTCQDSCAPAVVHVEPVAAQPVGQRRTSASAPARPRRRPAPSGRRRRRRRVRRRRAARSTSVERVGHRGAAVLLVQVVAGRASSCSGCARERGDQQRGPPGVGRGVGVRHRRGQQPAGDLGGHRGRRHEHDGLRPAGRRRERDRVALAVLVAPGDGEAAVEGAARRCRGGPRCRAASRNSASSSASSARRRRPAPRASATPADDRGGRRAEAAGVRDDVGARAAAGPAAGAHQVEGRPHRRGPRGGTRRGARRRRPRRSTSTSSPLAVDLGGQLVAQRQREPEGVEARAEVGRGRRHRDPHRAVDEGRHVGPQSSPAAAAAAVDVGVDDRVDDRATALGEPLERGGGVLEPVAGDGDRRPCCRGTTSPPAELLRAARRCRRPRRARRRRRRATASSRCAARICSSVTAAKRPPDSSRGRLGELPRGGVADPDRGRPGLRVGERLAGHQRRGALGLEAAHHRRLGGHAERRRTACSRASTPRCCRRCRPAAGGSRGRRRGSRRSRTPRSSAPRGAPG